MPILTTQSARSYGFGKLISSASIAAYESIATLYGTGSSDTVSFTNIPNTYKHLEIRCYARDTSASTDSDDIAVTFNGDTAANYWYQLGGSYQGVNLSSNAITSAASYIDAGLCIDGGQTSGWHSYNVYRINNYTSAFGYKTLFCYSASPNISNMGYMFISSGVWKNYSTTINRIDLKALGAATNFSTTSKFMLFGIKG